MFWNASACSPVHVAQPLIISCTAASVTLAMELAHASDAQVVGVRGTWASSSVLPHEDSNSFIFARAPPHVESGSSRRRRSPSSMTSEAGVALIASEQAIMLNIITRPEGCGRLEVLYRARLWFISMRYYIGPFQAGARRLRYDSVAGIACSYHRGVQVGAIII